MAAPSFACDAMLGSVAHWLRFAGFDTTYQPARSGVAVAALARAEGRWLLTSDRDLASAAGPRVLLLHAKGVDLAIAELRTRLGLEVDPARFFTRCAECNGEIEEASRGAVVMQVPPFVAAHTEHFRRCRSCGRVYWSGSHVGRIAARLERLFVSPIDG